jgi:hypothetical protein
MKHTMFVPGVAAPKKATEAWDAQTWAACKEMPTVGWEPPFSVTFQPVSWDYRRVLSPLALVRLVPLVVDGLVAAGVIANANKQVGEIITLRSKIRAGAQDGIEVTLSDVNEPF